jgi:hypothetical protein
MPPDVFCPEAEQMTARGRIIYPAEPHIDSDLR